LALFGAVPPLSGEDLARITRGKLDGAFQLDSAGTRKPVELVDLLPNGGAGWIELDPTATRFRIDINPVELVNGGSWVSRGLEPGDTFVGSADWGRLVRAPRRISRGQHLYFVATPGTVAGLPFEEKFRLGRLEVVRLAAKESQLAALRKFVPAIELDFEGLRVDVVTPLSVPPSEMTFGRIRVPKGKDVLLSVGLPRDKDRPLEVFPIPYNGVGQVTIPSAGLGVPRFLRLNLDGEESQRILIHWPFESERDWVLDFIPVEPTPSHTFSEVDPVIGLSLDSGPLLNPLRHSSITFSARTDSRGSPVLPRVTLVAPDGFSIRLKGEFPGEDGNPIWIDEPTRADARTIESRLKDIFARGCRTLEMGFGTLGRITLISTGFFERAVARSSDRRRLERERAEALAREERIRQEELENIRRAEERRVWRERMIVEIHQSLRDRREAIPRHISGVFVRNLLGLPADTGKEELQSLRSMVRKVRRELRSGSEPDEQETVE